MTLLLVVEPWGISCKAGRSSLSRAEAGASSHYSGCQGGRRRLSINAVLCNLGSHLLSRLIQDEEVVTLWALMLLFSLVRLLVIDHVAELWSLNRAL